ncbi:hypothetical protein Fot_27965 [Forsythia ovata]|uniref:Uncharacterized protein n=1 Tax=Forsythia ovata TaxID=205694 RepID=A0ABD1TMQ3_9LAMI
MSGFYFSNVPKLKIRRRGVVDDILPPPPVLFAVSDPGVIVLQTPKTIGGTPTLLPPDKYEYINIGSRRDKLDPTVLEKLPAPAAIAATLVHKYWTSAFSKAADNAELIELLKLAEMYTSQSHVLNCELYKVLAMKVDELRSTVGRDEDVDTLRAENKDLREQLVFSEDARARATYDITKAKTI